MVKKSNLKIVFQYRGLLLVFLTLRNLALSLMRNFFLFFSLFFLSFSTQAKLTLPAILSDNMVLQQNSVVKLWGTSSLKKSVTVKVSWSSTWFQTWTKADGSWEIQLFTPAGSFQEHWIKISDAADQKNLQNVLIGEVWLCSGQSNMAMTYRGYRNQPIADAEQTISEANNVKGIRTFNVEKEASFTPKNSTGGVWLKASSSTLSDFSVVGYTYAQALQQELHVPIGFINSSYGGSTIEGWLNAATLEKHTDKPIDKNIPDSLSFLRQTVFFYNMIRPLRQFKIKGVLWYQGEGNSSKPDGYAQKLLDLIFLWRFTFADNNLPFYLVEIAPYLYDHPTAAAKLREAQSEVALSVPNCGIVSTIDLVPLQDAANIHPPQKKPIGSRLANLALSQTYMLPSENVNSPRFSHYEIQGNTCVLYFDNATTGLTGKTIDNQVFTGFEIADSTQRFTPVTAAIGPSPNSLVIEFPTQNFGQLKAIRYCFKNYEAGTVFNMAGLPLFPFRTDDWD